MGGWPMGPLPGSREQNGFNIQQFASGSDWRHEGELRAHAAECVLHTYLARRC